MAPAGIEGVSFKSVVKRVSPPILIDAGRWAKHKLGSSMNGVPEWEYIPEGWSRASEERNIKGWNVPDVLEAYKTKWPEFVRSLEGTWPLGISHEADRVRVEDCSPHNTIMAYAYVLALASRNTRTVSILDWGGGIGHYYLIGKAVLPGVELAYHCRDLPILAEYGRSLFPEAHFYDDDSCLEQKYDLVVSSSSLQYAENWQDVLTGLAGATKGYLYVTRIPVVRSHPSFVVLQRPYGAGYGTEYLGWFLNRGELVERAADAGMKLIREFFVGERAEPRDAPDIGQYRGFLFEPAH